MKVGVLAFQGDVIEHIGATEAAAAKLKLQCSVCGVRTAKGLEGLDALIIPGGESTTMYKLCAREGMLDKMRGIRALFGTCAGAIMLARIIHNEEKGQGTLGLMDIVVDRNAYGCQAESFEEDIGTALGKVHAVFIRAPRIRSVGEGVEVLASRGREILACEQKSGDKYYMAACFHPELTTSVFHERLLVAVRRA
ncbi:MAG: pyridoxal 5'-phosphate synthase glutaminase subunit PdxT [Candidatus Micrarchaeota archaeon]